MAYQGAAAKANARRKKFDDARKASKTTNAAAAAWERRKKYERRAKEAGADAFKTMPTGTASEAHAARSARDEQIKGYHAASDRAAVNFLAQINWRPGDTVDVSNLQASIDAITQKRAVEQMAVDGTSRIRRYRDDSVDVAKKDSPFIDPNKPEVVDERIDLDYGGVRRYGEPDEPVSNEWNPLERMDDPFAKPEEEPVNVDVDELRDEIYANPYEDS